MSFGVCNSGKSNNWLLIAGAAILAGILIFFLLTTGVTAFASVFNTATPTVAAGAAVPFPVTGPLANITFTAPSTLTVGPTAGGTYLVTYRVNLTFAAAGSNTFAVTVNGAPQAATANGVTVAAAGTATVSQTAEIVIPANATVQLVNTSPATSAVLNNTFGGVTVPSAILNLERIGP